MRQEQAMSSETATADDCDSSCSLTLSLGHIVDVHACYGLAAGVWSEHRPDRAWLEWGICWPPLSIRRPRCLSCAAPWPCVPVLTAHEQMTKCEVVSAFG